MPKLIVTRGLPGSGKSTWALQQVQSGHKIVRVNRDTIRLMLHGKQFEPKYEDIVTSIRDRAISQLLYMGYTVINDDTNLSDKRIKELETIAKATEAEFEVNDSFLSVSVQDCIKRDLQRTASVGKDVIERMYYDYWKQQEKPANEGEFIAIICDLDGTLALIPDGANKYDRDFTKDILNKAVADLIWCNVQCGSRIVLMSGRDERAREQTVQWLNDKAIHYDELYMRSLEEQRTRVKDTAVKKRLYMENVQGKYKILYVVDDRPSVVRMWRAELGLTVLQCGPNMEF